MQQIGNYLFENQRMREISAVHASFVSKLYIKFCSLVVYMDEGETVVPCGMFLSWALLGQCSRPRSAKVLPDSRLNERVNADCTNDAETPSEL